MNDPDRWTEVRALFDELSELPGPERNRRLASMRAEAPDLADTLEALLRADAGEGILEEPLLDAAATLLLDEGDTSAGRSNASTPPAEGDRIGPYRIVCEAGRGGMGTVYEAERADGQFQKRVALKVIREDLVGPGTVRRFLEERQILASLDHPAIARLLDGGITDQGVPWYAMEFVEGTRIDRACDEGVLTLSRRLALFIRVCGAVSYAHRSLVLHRDLKPSNILVTPDGSVGLLDFGVGRILAGGEGGDGSPATLLQWLTPDYASPEQLRGGPTTTASDVYALGVLLHELLTGTRPLMDRDGEPTPPSSTIPTAAYRAGGEGITEVAERARLRGTTPRGLRRRLTGDLDAVLLKALRREPAERYATVDALAGDLTAYLAGYPVSARGASRRYRIRRYLGRHRAAVAATLTLLVVGSGVGIGHTRAIAVERDTARAEAERAEEIASFIQELFAVSDPLGAGVGPRSVQDFLATGAGRLRTELADQPERRALLLRALGKIYENLGDYAEADVLFSDALELRSRHLPDGHDLLLESLQDLGALRRRQGAFAEADPLLHQVLEARMRGGSALRHASALEELAELRRLQADLDAAEDFHRQALAIRAEAVGPTHPLVSNSLTALAVLARQRGELNAAEDLHRQALAIRRAELGQRHAYVAESLRNLAIVLHEGVRYEEARALYQEALAMQLELLGPRHPMVGLTRNSYGALLRALGETEAAAEQYELALELQRFALGPAHPRLANSITNAALTVLELGDLGRAEALAREGLDMRLDLLDADHPSVATSRNVLAFVLRHAGRPQEAEAELVEADRIYVDRLGPDHPSVATNRVSLAFVRTSQGDPVGAERLFREALAIYEGHDRGGHPEAARALSGLAETLVEQGRANEGEILLREALAILRTHLPDGHPDVSGTVTALHDLLRRLGRHAEADALAAGEATTPAG